MIQHHFLTYLKFYSLYFVEMLNVFCLFCSKRVILLRVPGAEVSSGVPNSEGIRITCAHCHLPYFVSSSFDFNFSYEFGSFLRITRKVVLCLTSKNVVKK